MNFCNSTFRFSLSVALLAGCARTLAADSGRTTYAQRLVDLAALHHPELESVVLYAARPDQDRPEALARHPASAAPAPAGDVLAAMRGPASVAATRVLPGRVRVLLPLLDAANRVAGALELGFRSDPARPAWKCDELAASIRNALAQVIPDAPTLSEPFLTGASPGDILAQKLTLQALARHPDILVVAMHITPPGQSVNRVVAINEPDFLGRASDAVDTDTEKTGKIVMQVIPKSHRLEVHMPLLAADGARVGTVCTVYLWDDERQAPDFLSRSLAVRDELRPLIPSYAALFRP